MATLKLKSLRARWAWLVPLVVIALGVWFTHLGSSNVWVAVWDILGSFFGGSFVTIKLDNRRENETKRLQKELLRSKINAAAEKGSICDLLWPNYREPDAREKHAAIRIALPDPPAEVQSVLVKAARARLNLQLAVVREAIALREDPYDVLMAVAQRPIFQESWLSALLDPIVFAIEGSAVVVIAQYGDFPIEQELVEQVVNSVYLA